MSGITEFWSFKASCPLVGNGGTAMWDQLRDGKFRQGTTNLAMMTIPPSVVFFFVIRNANLLMRQGL